LTDGGAPAAALCTHAKTAIDDAKNPIRAIARNLPLSRPVTLLMKSYLPDFETVNGRDHIFGAVNFSWFCPM
jgi:hypothetical protein